MPLKGFRPNALGGLKSNPGGRPKGSLKARSDQTASKLQKDGGLLPLDIQTYAMRFHYDRHLFELAKTGKQRREGKILAELKLASDYADKAAPYLHPRLQSVEHGGNFRVTFEEALKQLQQPETPEEQAEALMIEAEAAKP